jgi:hypothetical protein
MSAGWGNGIAEWVEGDTAYVSVVFSWMLQKAYARCIWYKQAGYQVRAGGPAVKMNPKFLAGVATLGGQVDALSHHNPDATYTTRGCIRYCDFCCVSKIEGFLKELPDSKWEPKKIICDNNLLAASYGHFRHVIERLLESGIKGIDFNGGLDARLLTTNHAKQLAKLPGAILHTAWDSKKSEFEFRRAYGRLRRAGIAASRIRVYVLIGFNDSPKDALYRLETIRKFGSYPNPMRYQPLNAKKKNEYVAPKWTEYELKRFMRYWSRQSYLSGIPFEEYDPRKRKLTQ